MSIRPEELQLAWDAAKADYDAPFDDENIQDEPDAFEEIEAELEEDLDGDPYDVYAFGMYRHVLRRNLRALADSGAKFSSVQPKAIALAAAANERSGVILDIEANSITVIVLREGLPEVVREVGIDQKMTPAQWIQSVTTQVSRTVAFHDSMYPDTPLSDDSALFLTGSTDSVAGSAEMAAGSIPYRRKSLPPTLRAPEDFPFARYAANVGLALVTGKHWWQRTRVSIIDRPMLDFRPTEFKPKPFPIQAALTSTMVGALVLALGGLYQMTTSQQNAIAEAKQELASVERNVGLKELRVRRAADQRAEITQLQIQTEELLDKINLVKDRERGYARVVDVVTDHAASIADVDVLEIDDDGELVEIGVGGADLPSVLRFVRLLEDEPGFTDVRIRSVGSQEENDEAAGEETGVGVGVGSGVGQLPGGPLAAPEDAEASGHAVTFKLSVTRTPRLEAPISEEDAEAVGIELES
jgi:Tfp pilus assembly protein PilN